MLRCTRPLIGNTIRLCQFVVRRTFHSCYTLLEAPIRSKKGKIQVIMKDGDFTNYGILPYLQGKVNSLINPTDAKYATENTEPTNDQRKLLSVLQSNYSVLQRGEPETGKTLALILYLVNLSLTRTPNYKYLASKGTGYDSVVIVPTDELVDKYKSLIEYIMKGIPQDCCPGELILEDKQSLDRKYNLTRVPLTVDFLYSNKPHTQVTSQNQPSSGLKTQIIITTISQFKQMMDGNNQTLNLNGLANIKTLAVDDFDLYLKTTTINGDTLIETYGKKSKYRNILETQIKRLQDFHIDEFRKSVNKRLLRTKQIYRDDPNLEDRLTKESRRVLYKPIQYCFIANNNEPYKQMLAMKSNTSKLIASYQTIESQQNIQSNSSYHNQINQNYVNLLKQKGVKRINQIEDPQNAFVEKLIRFNDHQREFKKSERPLITIGNYGENLFSNLNTYITIGMMNKKSPKLPTMKDIVWKVKPNHSNTKIMDKHLELSGNNFKNLEKAFLKYKYLTNLASAKLENDIAALIYSSIQSFQESTMNSGPIVIIIPSYFDSSKIVCELRNLQSTKSEFCFVPYDSSESLKACDNKCLVMNSSDLIGQGLQGFENMFVIGLDSCLHQTSFQVQIKNTIDEISGIQDPIGNLIPYYMSKLNRSTSKEKNLILVFDGQFPEQNKRSQKLVEQDLKKLSELIFYNKLPEVSTIKLLSDNLQLRRKIPIGLDETYVTQIKDVLMKSSINIEK